MVSSPLVTVSFNADLKKSISNLSHVPLTTTKELLMTERQKEEHGLLATVHPGRVVIDY